MSTIRELMSQLITITVLLFGLSSMSFADNTSKDAPITGLVINQTNSYLAQTFYQSFCLAWHEHKGSEQFNITLKENHSARGGRQVQVIFDHQVAYVATLPSGRINVSAIASGAAEMSIQRVQQFAIQNLALSDPDLAFDEI